MRPKIYITRKIPDEALALLKQECEINMWDEEETPVPREILKKEVENIDGLFCMLTDQIDQEIMEQAPRLKVISNMAVGYNNIDVADATEKGVMVTNTPGVLTDTTADLTFALLMSAGRRLMEASDYLRSGKWQSWSPMQLTGQDIHGSVLGIIGMGRIGQAVAKRANGFNMNVIYYNRSRKPDQEQRLGLIYRDLEQLLHESDYVVVLTPYNEETHHLIGEREIDMMKSTAVLINTSRGSIIDEQALYEALNDNKIWAAGLDVFEKEPIGLDNPLLSLSNVVTLPHIGSASIKTRTKMAKLAAKDLLKGLNEEKPVHLVNVELLN